MKKLFSLLLALILVLSCAAPAYAAGENGSIQSVMTAIADYVQSSGVPDAANAEYGGAYTISLKPTGTKNMFIINYFPEIGLLQFVTTEYYASETNNFASVIWEYSLQDSSYLPQTRETFVELTGGFIMASSAMNPSAVTAASAASHDFITGDGYTSVPAAAGKILDDALRDGLHMMNLLLAAQGLTAADLGFTAYTPGHNYHLSSQTKPATAAENGSHSTMCICGKTDSVPIYHAAQIKLSKTTYVYDGKVKTPAVTVIDANGKTLVENRDYTVTYASGRKNVGTYKVTVKGKGDHSFTKTLTFKINPVKTAISKLAAKSKAITVKWSKKAAQVSGYEIQYSLKKSFASAKTVTVKGASTVSKTIKKLKGGKLYYVRIRTYKTVGSTKFYSDWSAAKSIRAKK